MSTWQRNRDNGMCGQCGKVPPEDNKARCRECRDEATERVRLRRDKRKAAGLCIDCGEREPATGVLRCETCRVEDTEKMRLRRGKRKDAGLCECGKSKPEDGKAKCLQCLKRQRESLRSIRDDRKAAGLCIFCAEPSELVVCHECNRGGLRKHMSFLRFRDGQTCYICRSMLPAENGSDVHVHHVIPRKIGGPDDLDNLALTHARCNLSIGATWIYETPEKQMIHLKY